MTREQYGEKFRQVQEYLHSGDCYQVNLAQRFHATYSGDEWQAFLQLNQANRAPFSAFLRLEQGAILAFRQSGLFFVIIVKSRPRRLKAPPTTPARSSGR
ncbi:para-aminobenzoate synthase component I [Escherichia coli]|uniref:Para-aminobenzoate synthase component I n=1 Tax=Escherichia coli TaxID=562 RepID=A0A2X3LX52_ECOLX|nr:para-aminobenzoate synthase component I [Escherichia coli]